MRPTPAPRRAASLRTAATTAASLSILLACDGGRVVDPPVELPEIRDFAASGSVVTLDGSVPTGLRVTLDGEARVSAAVGTDGRFAIDGRVRGDSATVIIDVGDGVPRTTLPALLRLPTAATATNLQVMVVPRSWTVTGGRYAGTTVTVSMDAAFRPPCPDTTNINCDGYYPAAWRTGAKLWPATALPVRLAFDHERSHQAISAADSAHFWTIVERMNDDAGMELFRPARAADLTISPVGTPTGGVVVRVDTTLAGFGAWANWWWNAQGELHAGVVRPRTLQHLRSGTLMTHELLHTHGFKHSCSWSTVMGGYGGCGSHQGLSGADVAYMQLARAVHAAQRQHGAPHGLIAALQGERVVMLNKPLFALPVRPLLEIRRTDGIGDGDHAH